MQTLGELAKHYQKNEQAIRRAFKVMMKLNKLTLGKDYVKENYKDSKHFTYLIDPEKFDEHYREISRRFDGPVDIKSDNENPASDIKSDIKTENQVISNDIKDDYIGTLKTQLAFKDKQIEALQESVKLKEELNIALNNKLINYLPEGKNEKKENVEYVPVEGEFKETQ